VPSAQTTIISCVLIVSGVICILMAIAYEQVKAHLSIGATQQGS